MRGPYRCVYTALFDDPDYQRLTPDARLTLLTVRQCAGAGPAAIFRYYLGVLGEQTGLPRGRLTRALRQLAALPTAHDSWIMFDALVLWVRHGLRHDPHIRLADVKHHAFILRTVSALPKSAVTLSFCDYYALPRPFQDPSKALGSTEPDPEPEPEPEPDPEPERAGATDRAAAHPASAPALSIPPSILQALDQCARLGAVPPLRVVKFWAANIRATNGRVDYAQEILKAEAWLVSNPRRAPKTNLTRFLHNWLARAQQEIAP